MAGSALPSGVVTFVVSDGDDTGPVETRGGVVVAAGVSVFERATDAVGAARDIVTSRSQSRVAVHTGEVTPADRDYSGPVLDRAARLRAIGRDGEVVVSAATAPLVLDAVPTGTRLVALGDARVRGLDRPEQAYALVAIPDVAAGTSRRTVVPPGLASRGVTAKETEVLRALQGHLSNAEIATRLYVSERTIESHVSSLLRKLHAGHRRELARVAASLLTAEPARTPLPVPLTSLVGRVGELATVANLLSTARVVTITGSAGVGKTRLAVEAANRHEVDTWFIDLTDVARDHGVAERVLWMLGGEETAGLDAMAALRARARDQRMLVVLDNCEHVIAAAAAVAGALVGASGAVTVLATSREPLGVADETVVPIDPLPVAHAVRLLNDRARAAGAALDTDDDRSVIELCRRLDGLPLALELVAPRLRTFAPDQLLDLLDRGARLDAGGRGHARHRTVEDALDWSYRLLDDDERALFDHLTVFPGSFGLDAVIDVCGASAIELLPRLVDRSLVTVDAAGGDRRYRLLDSVRRYGQRHLDADTAGALMARHCAHLVRIADRAEPELRGPDGTAWVRRLRNDQHNLVRVFEWALEAAPNDALLLVGALHLFWEDAGLRRQAITWAERALAAAPAAPEPVRVRALAAAVSLLAPWDQPRARRLAEAALELAARSGDPAQLARVRVEHARVEAYGDRPDRALEPVAAALSYFDAAGDTWHVAEVLTVRSYAEEPEVAVATLREAHARYTLTGDRIRIANTAYLLAATYARQLDDAALAEPLAREVVALAVEIDNPHEELHGRGVLADCAFVRGDDERADELAEECALAFGQLADHRCQARMQLLRARVALRRGRRAEALEHARATLAIARAGAHAPTIPGALEVAAVVIDGIDPGAAAVLRSAPRDRLDQVIATIDGVSARISVLATDAR